MIELKPCPLCGGEAELQRNFKGCRGSSTIIDEWEVTCKKRCCSTRSYADEIYHADNGEIVIEHNGAAEAAEVWNKRV